MKQRPNIDPGACAMLRFSGWFCLAISLVCCAVLGPSPLWVGCLLAFAGLLVLAYWISPRRD